jgi:quinoprotein relay system zinc metallohydrolase 2
MTRFAADGPGEARRGGRIGAFAAACALAGMLAWALAVPVPAIAAEDLPALAMKALAPGVFVHVGLLANATPENHGAIANVGFVVGKRCVAVIDSGGSLAEGRALRSAIKAVTPLPVCYVINTHVHPDHVYGNAAFLSDNPIFVGHKNLAASMQARREYYVAYLARTLGEAQAAPSVQVPPSLTVGPAGTPDALRRLDLGERQLTLQAWATSHTDNDITVRDEQSGTLWLGDLLFRERIPVIDGKVTGWLATMEQLRQLPATQVVPGHGTPGADWPAMLAPQQRYLTAVRDGVKAALKAHRTIGQAAQEVAAGERGNWALFDDFHAHNVTVVFTELEWDD